MFQTIIGTISSFMYSKLLVILLIGAGVYFTIRTRFPQVRLFKNACGSVMEKTEAVMEDRLTILKRHFIVARWQLFSALQ